MHRYVFVAAVLIAMLPSAPSFAVSQKQKMETCKFGADRGRCTAAAETIIVNNGAVRRQRRAAARPATNTSAAHLTKIGRMNMQAASASGHFRRGWVYV